MRSSVPAPEAVVEGRGSPGRRLSAWWERRRREAGATDWGSEWKPLAWIAGVFLAFYFLPVGNARFDGGDEAR